MSAAVSIVIFLIILIAMLAMVKYVDPINKFFTKPCPACEAKEKTDSK